jgi:hypothetical protein
MSNPVMAHNFLTLPELMRLGRHKPSKQEKPAKSLGPLTPIYMSVVQFVPQTVAPNVLSLAGLIWCVM